MADRWGWQSLFTFLAVFSGLVLLLMIFFLPEVSCLEPPRSEPSLTIPLSQPRRAQTLRSLVGNGAIPARGVNRSLISVIMNRRRRQRGDAFVPVTSLPPRKSWSDIDWLASLKMFREKVRLAAISMGQQAETYTSISIGRSACIDLQLAVLCASAPFGCYLPLPR